ncbi:MAG TPA: winged helix-turn-helix transcriptional regulator [Solirubrobacterales bacterium]|nr:winged helix-turn-helix transcriptional regulator [Solirubrobacterales bacterium]
MEPAASQAQRAREERARARSQGPPARVCPDFHHAVELIGKRWSGAIVWALSERPHYFAELCQAVPGLSDRLLSRRLRELEGERIVERSVYAGTPPRVSYALTEKGRALRPAIQKLRAWAQEWNSD